MTDASGPGNPPPSRRADRPPSLRRPGRPRRAEPGPAPGISVRRHGPRLLAYIIDVLIISVGFGAIAVLLRDPAVRWCRSLGAPIGRRGSGEPADGWRGGRVRLPDRVPGPPLDRPTSQYFWWRGGQTPGMKLFNLYVVRDADGGPLSGGQAVLRLFGLSDRAGGRLHRLPLGLRRRAAARLAGPDRRAPASSSAAAEHQFGTARDWPGPGLKTLPAGIPSVSSSTSARPDSAPRRASSPHLAGVHDRGPGRERACFGRRRFSDWPRSSSLLLADDGSGGLAALGNAMPLAWDGTDDGLPEGSETGPPERRRRPRDQVGPVEHAGGDADRHRDDRRGAGLSGPMVGAMRAAARAAGTGP